MLARETREIVDLRSWIRDLTKMSWCRLSAVFRMPDPIQEIALLMLWTDGFVDGLV
jgi:hypothetical protein